MLSKNVVITLTANYDLYRSKTEFREDMEKTKDLIGRTIAQHVLFKTLYIS